MSAPRMWGAAAVLGAVGVSLALGASPAGTSLASGSPSSGQSMPGMADMTDMTGMPSSAGSAAAPPPSQKAAMHVMDGMDGMGNMPGMPSSAGSAAPPSQQASMHAMHDMDGMPGMAGMDGMSDMPPSAASVASPASKPLPAGHDMHDMRAMPGMPGMQAPATESPALPANDHVPPPAPQQSMPAMSTTQMTQTMQMDDQAQRGMLLVDRLERSRSNDGEYASAWELEAWYGSDINRLWFLSEGERSHEGVEDARAELLWGHAFSTSWDWLAGARQDFGVGPSRQWLSLGVQGETAYFFELQAGLYAGPQGRSAARLEISRDLLLTQRLILTPRLEVNLYGKDDPQRQVRSGLSDAEAGLRLRYEVSRRFAPYIGVDWQRHFADGDALPFSRRFPARETSVLVGVKFWF